MQEPQRAATAEIMKIEVGKLKPNIKGEKTYVRHIKRLNQELMYSLKLKKVH